MKTRTIHVSFGNPVKNSNTAGFGLTMFLSLILALVLPAALAWGQYSLNYDQPINDSNSYDTQDQDSQAAIDQPNPSESTDESEENYNTDIIPPTPDTGEMEYPNDSFSSDVPNEMYSYEPAYPYYDYGYPYYGYNYYDPYVYDYYDPYFLRVRPHFHSFFRHDRFNRFDARNDFFGHRLTNRSFVPRSSFTPSVRSFSPSFGYRAPSRFFSSPVQHYRAPMNFGGGRSFSPHNFGGRGGGGGHGRR